MKYDYGDVVKISANAPSKFLKFRGSGSVCGIDENLRSERALDLGTEQNTAEYLVEFPTGQAIEVPEIYLKLG